MTLVEVLALMRRVYGNNVLLDVEQLEQLRTVLELHESDVRERCARVAEQDSDSLEAKLIAAAIRGEHT